MSVNAPLSLKGYAEDDGDDDGENEDEDEDVNKDENEDEGDDEDDDEDDDENYCRMSDHREPRPRCRDLWPGVASAARIAGCSALQAVPERTNEKQKAIGL